MRLIISVETESFLKNKVCLSFHFPICFFIIFENPMFFQDFQNPLTIFNILHFAFHRSLYYDLTTVIPKGSQLAKKPSTEKMDLIILLENSKTEGKALIKRLHEFSRRYTFNPLKHNLPKWSETL